MSRDKSIEPEFVPVACELLDPEPELVQPGDRTWRVRAEIRRGTEVLETYEAEVDRPTREEAERAGVEWARYHWKRKQPRPYERFEGPDAYYEWLSAVPMDVNPWELKMLLWHLFDRPLTTDTPPEAALPLDELWERYDMVREAAILLLALSERLLKFAEAATPEQFGRLSLRLDELYGVLHEPLVWANGEIQALAEETLGLDMEGLLAVAEGVGLDPEALAMAMDLDREGVDELVKVAFPTTRRRHHERGPVPDDDSWGRDRVHDPGGHGGQDRG
jgi:hypothetical protein